MIMDLPDEARDALDGIVIPAHVRSVLAKYWDDNVSDRTNFELISHWIGIASGHAATPADPGIDTQDSFSPAPN